MNKTEMAKILRIMQEHYRAENITEKTILAWHPLFEDYSYQETEMALKMMGAEREFTSFPAPASLIKYINMIRGKSDPNQLWEQAHKAMGKASTFTNETFNELPEELKIFFGSITQLKEYGLQDIDKIGFVKTAFMKELPIIESRIMAKKEMAKLVSGINGQLDDNHQRQLKELIGG